MRKRELEETMQKLMEDNGGIIPVVNALLEALHANHPVTKGRAKACAAQLLMHGTLWVDMKKMYPEGAPWEN